MLGRRKKSEWVGLVETRLFLLTPDKVTKPFLKLNSAETKI